MIEDESGSASKEEKEPSAEAEPYKPRALLRCFAFLAFIPRFYQHHKILTLIIAVISLLIIAGVSVTYFWLFRHKAEPESSSIEYSSTYFPLPELKLSIHKENDALGYLVIGITLKVASNAKLEEFKKKEPEMLDILHTYLTSITFDNLDKSSKNCLTSSVGLERLRENLIRRINIVLAPLKIESVLFRKLICQ